METLKAYQLRIAFYAKDKGKRKAEYTVMRQIVTKPELDMIMAMQHDMRAVYLEGLCRIQADQNKQKFTSLGYSSYARPVVIIDGETFVKSDWKSDLDVL